MKTGDAGRVSMPYMPPGLARSDSGKGYVISRREFRSTPAMDRAVCLNF